MTINKINSDNIYRVNEQQGVALREKELVQSQKIQEEQAKQSVNDKLEISNEGKRMQMIQSRINSGYYDKPEVMRELALKLSKAFPPEE
ncbi:MAG: hypothetical protein N2319_09830 [Candidatus Kapabacteria bacterium]|nr:hypothetical protein [Candidatus Kapabacteria bacterium]